MSRRDCFESKVITWVETGPPETVKAILGICNEKLRQRILYAKQNPEPVLGVGGVSEIHQVLLSAPKRKYTRKPKVEEIPVDPQM